MSKRNEYGSWLTALYQLTEIIKKEYQDGGKLPPVPEMSKRLNVAENTYIKALKLVCQHGLAHGKHGRAGTLILPESQRTQKIGLLPSGENPLLPHMPLLQLLKQMGAPYYAIQMISAPSPERLLDQMMVLNLSALYAVNPDISFFPGLQKIQQKGIPLAIVQYYDYTSIEEAMKYGLPYFHTEPDCVASEACSFAERNNIDSILLIEKQHTILSDSFAGACHKSGRKFSEDNFLPYAQIKKKLLSKIRKLRGGSMVFSKCGCHHARIICELLQKIPREQRPTLVFSIEVKNNLEFIGTYGSMISGFFDIQSSTLELACARLLEAIHSGDCVQPEQNSDFHIIKNPSFIA